MSLWSDVCVRSKRACSGVKDRRGEVLRWDFSCGQVAKKKNTREMVGAGAARSRCLSYPFPVAHHLFSPVLPMFSP